MKDSVELILHGVGYSQLIFTNGSVLPIAKSQDIEIKVDATEGTVQGGDSFYDILNFITKKTGSVTITNATMTLADLKAVTGDDVTSSAERLVNDEVHTVTAGALQLAQTSGVDTSSVVIVNALGSPLKALSAAPGVAQAGARTYTVTTNAVAADTLTIDSVVLTATSSTTNGTQFAIGATIADTVTNIKTAIAANSTLSARYTVTGTGAAFTLTETVAGSGHTPSTATYTGTIVVSSGTATTSVAGIAIDEFYVTSVGAVTVSTSLNSTEVSVSYYYEDATGLSIHSLDDSVPGNCEVRHRIITDEMTDGKRYELNIRVYRAKAKGSYDYTAKIGTAFAPKLEFSILDASRVDKRTLSYSVSEYVG